MIKFEWYNINGDNVKKVFIFVFCLFAMAMYFLGVPVKASKNPILVYEFYGSDCRYCVSLNTWFDSIEKDYGEYFELVKFEVWNDSQNNDLMYKVSNHFNDNASGVPYLIIGRETINGFGGSDYEKQRIINYIMDEYNKNESERYNDVYDIVYNGYSGEVKYTENISEISGVLSTLMDFITE